MSTVDTVLYRPPRHRALSLSLLLTCTLLDQSITLVFDFFYHSTVLLDCKENQQFGNELQYFKKQST